MPGLVMIFAPGRTREHRSALASMMKSMHREPFYSEGTYEHERIGVLVGWKCHKGSYCDGMPFVDPKGRWILFFYGETHAATAARNGNAFRASELLDLLGKDQEDLFRSLNGWFNGILLDLQAGEVVVFNDRFGMQRLYWHEKGGVFFFASEAKALLAANPEVRRLNPSAVAEWLSCQCVLGLNSLFNDIYALPPASAWRFSRGDIPQRKTYFQPETWESQTALHPESFEQSLRELLPRVVTARLRGSLPVAISLTGGFDTRMIMAHGGPALAGLPCYTFGGTYRECFDVRLARKVASACECKHTVVSLDAEFFSTFAKLADETIALSDGQLGVFSAYEMYLNRRARALSPVRLTGSYGSEVMRGARAFKAIDPEPGWYNRDLDSGIRAAHERFAEFSRGHNLTFSLYRQAPWLYGNRLAVEQSQVIVRTPFMDRELVSLMYRAPTVLSRYDLAVRLIQSGNPVLASFPTDTGNASALRRWWMQFLFKADYCYKSGMPQWLETVHFASPWTPEKMLIGRHRFAHPRVWIRRELAQFTKDVLLDSRTLNRPFFDKRGLPEMVLAHQRGHRNHTDDIERALTLELASRIFVDAQ